MSNFTFNKQEQIHDKYYLLTDRQTILTSTHTHTHMHALETRDLYTCIFLVGPTWHSSDHPLYKYLKYNNNNINNSLTKSFTFLPLTRLNFDNKVIKILFRLKKLVAASSWLVTTNLVISNQNVLKLLQRRSGEGLVGVTY